MSNRLRWYQLIVPLVRGFWVIVVKDYLRAERKEP